MSPCPLCAGVDRAPFAILNDRMFNECARCRSVFQDPLPSIDASIVAHTDRYEGASSGYFRKVNKKLRRARGRLRWLRLLVPARGRVLDVGCNGGFFCEAARATGFEAHGVDVDPVSVDYARKHYPGCMFHLGTVDKLAGGAFDLVYSSEVLEHVPDTDGFVRGIAAALRPGGVLFVTCPDVHHWRRPRDPSKWDMLRDPGHCVFPSRHALRAKLAAIGLDYVFSIPALKPGIKAIFRKDLRIGGTL